MPDSTYAGSELELFAHAHNWKSYWADRIRSFVKGDVLEVGAGIGSNTRFLSPGVQGRWVCIEPDSQLIDRLTETLKEAAFGRAHEIRCCTVQDLDETQSFDTVLYIDVLEHIEDDRQELETAASSLRAGGRLIILSPAHQWLFSPFDAAIGHFRRYNRTMLRLISPLNMRVEQLIYLDCCGLMLSTANLLLLRQSMPSETQLRIWDKHIVPASRVLDRMLFYLVGKSILGVWRREEG
jgi:SAM-dependent methyltransferase